MTPDTEAALIRLGFLIAEEVLVPWLRELLARKVEPISALGVAREIVNGIERDYGPAAGEAKRRLAADAIKQMLVNRGGRPTDRDVGKLLELALGSAP